jgi:hypothetical protein
MTRVAVGHATCPAASRIQAAPQILLHHGVSACLGVLADRQRTDSLGTHANIDVPVDSVARPVTRDFVHQRRALGLRWYSRIVAGRSRHGAHSILPLQRTSAK